MDNASTTPISKESVDIINKTFSDKWHNPSGFYYESQEAKKLLEESRKKVKKAINAEYDDEIIFTSSGCESNSMALDYEKYNIVYDVTSHSSIIEKCKFIEEVYKNKVYALPVDHFGNIDLIEAYSIIQKASYNVESKDGQDVIVTICGGNNESGTIQNIAEIRNIIESVRRNLSYACHRVPNIYLHVDGTQLIANNHINVNSKDCPIDMLTISGHKIGCPSGVGILYKRKGIDIYPIIFGEQEHGMRGGTENLPYIIAFANALKRHQRNKNENRRFIEKLQSYLIFNLLKIQCCSLVGNPTQRLANNVCVVFKGIDAESLVMYLDNYDIKCSTGSACNSFNKTPSHVLKAMGYSDESCYSEVRFTLSENNTTFEIDEVIRVIKQFIKNQGGESIA